MDDKKHEAARKPSVEEITIDEALRLLAVKGTNRLIQVRRDALDPKRIVNIIVHE